MGAAWERHGMCELASKLYLVVLKIKSSSEVAQKSYQWTSHLLTFHFRNTSAP
jgi:hypothetical protein